jgi:hypothetical protein
MDIYISQLRERIRGKIETINDPDYLASLDAILTYEAVSPEGKMPSPVQNWWARLCEKWKNKLVS